MSDRYTCLMADPPYSFHNKLDMNDGVDRSAMSQYRTMDVDGIRWFLKSSPDTVIVGGRGSSCPAVESDSVTAVGHPSFTPLEDRVADDAVLLLWAPSAFIVDGTATSIARSWGFEPKQMIHWIKGRISTSTAQLVLQVGMGRYSRNCSETMLLCTKGKCMKLIQDKGVPNVILAKRGQHSAKPDEAYRWAERLLPGPRLSIFERRRIEGWDVIGDEIS